MAGSNEKKNDKYSAIRGVLRKYSSFDKPMKLKDIQVILNQQEYDIKRHAITTAMDDMGVIFKQALLAETGIAVLELPYQTADEAR